MFVPISFKKAVKFMSVYPIYYKRIDGRGGIHLDPNPRENERLYKGKFINLVKCVDVCKLGRLFYRGM